MLKMNWMRLNENLGAKEDVPTVSADGVDVVKEIAQGVDIVHVIETEELFDGDSSVVGCPLTAHWVAGSSLVDGRSLNVIWGILR